MDKLLPAREMVGTDARVESQRPAPERIDAGFARLQVAMPGAHLRGAQRHGARGVGVGSKDWRVIRDLADKVDLDWVMLACSFTVYHLELPSGAVLKISESNIARHRENARTWGDTAWASWPPTAQVVLTQ